MFCPDSSGAERRLRVPAAAAGLRVDVFLSRSLAGISRAFVKRLADEGRLAVAGGKPKPGYRLKGGEEIVLHIPPPQTLTAEAEPLPLNVLYEDEHIIVVDKPAGMVTHPCPAHGRGTLVNALLWHCRDLVGIGGTLRPGIVHRLDKDTSGVIVCAKNDAAHRALSAQFAARAAEKIYLAIVSGAPPENEGIISAPLGRHTNHRTLRAVTIKGGREAVTAYRVLERLRLPSGSAGGARRQATAAAAFLECRPRSGRTHQIRVHLAHLGLPILGDKDYAPPAIRHTIAGITVPRLCLHAWKLGIRHPATGQQLWFEAQPPLDMKDFLERLRAAAGA